MRAIATERHDPTLPANGFAADKGTKSVLRANEFATRKCTTSASAASAFGARRGSLYTSQARFQPPSAAMFARFSRILSAALLLALALLPVRARCDNPKRPKLYLIVCDGLTFDDLHLGTTINPHLAEIAERGSVGLMNCATAAPRSDTSAMLTLAAGRLAPSEPSDEKAANDWEKAPGERISAAESHRARLGGINLPPYIFDPHKSVKHLGIAELKARGLDSDRLGALLDGASPPIRTWIVGNADTSGWRRRAALLVVDKLGVGSGMVALRSYDPRLPYGLTDNPTTIADYATQADADFVVIHLGNGARAEAARTHLPEAEYENAHNQAVHLLDLLVMQILGRAKRSSPNILIVAPRPPSANASHSEDWNRLTPILGFGPDFPPGVFVSATTRTRGLIAETDIAPTILSLYHLPPSPLMTGRPLQVVRASASDSQGRNRLSRLGHIDFIAWADSAGLAPFLVVLGAVCFLSCVGGTVSLRTGNGHAAAVFAFGLVFAMNFTAAQLFAPLLTGPTLVAYGLTIAACMAALTALCYGIARLLRISVPVAACALNLSVALIDIVTGQHLLKDALISNYYLPGFRYYGIGNDFLGLILGAAIAGAFSLMDDIAARRADPRRSDRAAAVERADALPFHYSQLRLAMPPTPGSNPLLDRITRPIVAPQAQEVVHAESNTANATAEAGAVRLQDAPKNVDRSMSIVSLCILLIWVVIAVVLGSPWWGANSGSLIVTTVAFGTGWLVLRGTRKLWLFASGFAIAGIAVAFGFAYLDARFHGAQSSHAGAALRAAAATRGAAYLWDIIVRKVRFNLGMFAAPWTWVTASACAGALLLAPMLAEDEIEETKRRRPWLARSLPVLVAASVAALLFKDTGVVTVCYLMSATIIVGFYYMLVPGCRGEEVSG